MLQQRLRECLAAQIEDMLVYHLESSDYSIDFRQKTQKPCSASCREQIGLPLDLKAKQVSARSKEAYQFKIKILIITYLHLKPN